MENVEPAANPAVAEEAAPAEYAEIVSLDAQTEANTPAVGSEEPSYDDLLNEAEGAVEATPEAELIDVEYEGETFKVPPKLKDALLRQADYTKKTMEVAETRKAIEAEKAQIEHVRNISTAKVNAMTQAQVLDYQIKSIEATQIDGLSQEQINSLRMDLRDLYDQKNQVSTDIQKLTEAERYAETEEVGKLRQQALQEAATLVPNWSDTRRAELETLAKELGASLDPDEITEPWAYKVLHFADIGKKFIERQKKAGQMRQAQAGTPTQSLGNSKAGSKAPEEMSMAEYIASRKSGQI
jgi:hypothetical protein